MTSFRSNVNENRSDQFQKRVRNVTCDSGLLSPSVLFVWVGGPIFTLRRRLSDSFRAALCLFGVKRATCITSPAELWYFLWVNIRPSLTSHCTTYPIHSAASPGPSDLPGLVRPEWRRSAARRELPLRPTRRTWSGAARQARATVRRRLFR